VRADGGNQNGLNGKRAALEARPKGEPEMTRLSVTERPGQVTAEELQDALIVLGGRVRYLPAARAAYVARQLAQLQWHLPPSDGQERCALCGVDRYQTVDGHAPGCVALAFAEPDRIGGDL
jgi:hypothetical protein